MTRDQLMKAKIRPYMSIDFKYRSSGDGEIVTQEMMLCGVNWDDEILTLFPFPGDEGVQRELEVDIRWCDFTKKPRPRLSVVKQREEK